MKKFRIIKHTDTLSNYVDYIIEKKCKFLWWEWWSRCYHDASDFGLFGYFSYNNLDNAKTKCAILNKELPEYIEEILNEN